MCIALGSSRSPCGLWTCLGALWVGSFGGGVAIGVGSELACCDLQSLEPSPLLLMRPMLHVGWGLYFAIESGYTPLVRLKCPPSIC